ncbi:hypothetical protein HHUSO_G12708 [Huso huso]|uniref:MULE transposase domain-containing protein n=1 Tax=Huso huso TaxID=61971 RepID=A0ABR0ZJP8_HUSHU
MSEESSDILSLCLKKVQEAVGEFQPRCVMVDRDMKEINAVHTVFPYAKVLLCWFHVLQAVHRWIVRRDGGCSQNLSAKNEVIRSMIALKQCSTAAEFEKMSKEVIVKIDRETGSSVISQYLQDHWFRNADMWANFGRRVYHQDSETNNLVERFFFSMKYQFLHGYANRRVD